MVENVFLGFFKLCIFGLSTPAAWIGLRARKYGRRFTKLRGQGRGGQGNNRQNIVVLRHGRRRCSLPCWPCCITTRDDDDGLVDQTKDNCSKLQEETDEENHETMAAVAKEKTVMMMKWITVGR